MKHDQIQAGMFYHDAKAGVREVIVIEGAPLRVKYRVLAAKQTQAYDYESRAMKSLIGSESVVSLESFASWARSAHDRRSIDSVLLSLEARRVKLSPGEQAFVRATLDAAHGKIADGMRVGIDHTEGRSVAGLVKKGIVVRDGDEAVITKLGAAYVAIAQV
ncbi:MULTISPECIES: hypothetical protein [Pandoraea]|uniref:Uncharacterized protein n=2 Tax=Pandoraea TaxID=93217 RepID=A0A5E4XIQ1_9BURK|nr:MULTISPECIES: hypothetical protein [Pandoraea]VVE18434.1 hypothetical protein PCE31107_03020 [Pandoraea cepalis]VVE36251.1 hypothetical protein PTE31013_03941 [Pandoraea terrigena]